MTMRTPRHVKYNMSCLIACISDTPIRLVGLYRCLRSLSYNPAISVSRFYINARRV